jgi:hypothetical protein
MNLIFAGYISLGSIFKCKELRRNILYHLHSLLNRYKVIFQNKNVSKILLCMSIDAIVICNCRNGVCSVILFCRFIMRGLLPTEIYYFFILY